MKQKKNCHWSGWLLDNSFFIIITSFQSFSFASCIEKNIEKMIGNIWLKYSFFRESLDISAVKIFSIRLSGSS